MMTSHFVARRLMSRQPGWWAIILAFAVTAGFSASAAQGIEPAWVLESSPGGALAYSPDGVWLAIGAEYKGPFKLWKAGSKDEPVVIQETKSVFTSVAFSPDSKLVTASYVSLEPTENVVAVWDVANKQRLVDYKLGAFWATFTPDSKGLAIGKYNVIQFLDPRTGKPLSTHKAQDEASVSAGDFSTNGKLFATAGGDAKQLKFWDPRTGKLLRTIAIKGDCKTVAVSPDAKLVAYGVDNHVGVVEAGTGKELWGSDAHTDPVMKVQFSPDGKELATASHDGSARRWNSLTGAAITSYEPEQGMVQSVAYAPDQKTIAVGTSAVVLIYDLSKTDTNTASVRKPAPPMPKPAAPAGEPLKYKVSTVEWKPGDKRKLAGLVKKGIALFTSISGNMGGINDGFEINTGKDAAWGLEGKSQEWLVLGATTVSELSPIKFAPAVTRYEWSNGKPPLKMLHRKDGICVLAGVSGAFRGYGEEVKVRFGDDGYWYLEGKSQQGDLKAVAIGLKWATPGAWTVEPTTVTWKTGQEPVEMGPRTEGLAVLSGMSGNMLGGGEGAGVAEEDETWFLRGNSQQEELRFEAMFLRFAKARKSK